MVASSSSVALSLYRYSLSLYLYSLSSFSSNLIFCRFYRTPPRSEAHTSYVIPQVFDEIPQKSLFAIVSVTYIYNQHSHWCFVIQIMRHWLSCNVSCLSSVFSLNYCNQGWKCHVVSIKTAKWVNRNTRGIMNSSISRKLTRTLWSTSK